MLKVQGFFAIMFTFQNKNYEAQKRHLKDQMSFMMNLYMHINVQCFSIKCKKRHHKYCVSRTKLFTSGDIESNPGPVVTQGNNPNNRIEWNCYNLTKHNMA